MEDKLPKDADLDAVQDTQAKWTHSGEQKHKKHHHRVKIFLLVILVLLLIPTVIAGWFGFVPGLSSVMGANKAKDLGVTYAAADFESYKQKTGITFNDFANAPENPNKPGKKTVFADPKTVQNLQITQEELTAAGHYVGWQWMPLSNAQVRFSDGAVEVSGNINVEHLEDFITFIGGVGYSQSDVQKGISWGKKLVGTSPAVYIKSKASVSNDKLSYQLETVRVGRFNVPMDIASKVLSSGTTNAIVRADNFEAQSATASSGVLNFSGTYPTTIYVKH